MIGGGLAVGALSASGGEGPPAEPLPDNWDPHEYWNGSEGVTLDVGGQAREWVGRVLGATLLGGSGPGSGTVPDYDATDAEFNEKGALYFKGTGEYSIADIADLPPEALTYLSSGVVSYSLILTILIPSDQPPQEYVFDTAGTTGPGARLLTKDTKRLQYEIVNGSNEVVCAARCEAYPADEAFQCRIDFDHLGTVVGISINDRAPVTAAATGSFDTGTPAQRLHLSTRGGGTYAPVDMKMSFLHLAQVLHGESRKAYQRSYMQSEFGVVMPTLTDTIGSSDNVNIVIDGDSNSDTSHGTTDDNNWTRHLANEFVENDITPEVISANFAVSMSTVSDLSARGSTVDAASVDGKTNVLLIMVGVNDFLILGDDPATVLARLEAYIADRAASGEWDHIVPLQIPDANGKTADINTYNAALAGISGVSFVVARPSEWGNSSNTSYFNGDKVHLIAAGHAPGGAAVYSALDANL